jgi:hypothetical protein
MDLLVQFLLRLTFGLAFGMAITSPRLVSSGFYRNHLYVTLGLACLASLASFSAAPDVFWYAVAAALVSYVGSVCWLYEKKDAGKIAVWLVALISLSGALNQVPQVYESDGHASYLDRYFPAIEPQVTAEAADLMVRDARRMGFLGGVLAVITPVSSGLLLGMTLAAMLLGHWYLNSPTMELAPLRRLLLALAAAVVFQMVVSAVGLFGEVAYSVELSSQLILFLLLRWSFGLFGVLGLVWMAWQTLKIPNTQSATGILYVAVIGVFVGELTGLLLSAESAFPL